MVGSIFASNFSPLYLVSLEGNFILAHTICIKYLKWSKDFIYFILLPNMILGAAFLYRIFLI